MTDPISNTGVGSVVLCGACKKEILEEDYRWVVSFRKSKELGKDGFEELFCSDKCFLSGAENVEVFGLEEKVGKIELEMNKKGHVSWTKPVLLLMATLRHGQKES